MKKTVLRWGKNNSKLTCLAHTTGRKVASFDLLAGYTCPAANICKSFAKHGRVELGENAEFVCYAARTEAIYRNSFEAHKANLNYVNTHTTEEIASALISDIVTLGLGIVRIHASGDLYNLKYAKAWLLVASALPDVLFFGYTKIYSMYRLMTDCNIPNLSFAFSMGSRDDKMVQDKDVTCTVITSQEQAVSFPHDIICGNHKDQEGYSIDFHYICNRRSFGIALH